MCVCVWVGGGGKDSNQEDDAIVLATTQRNTPTPRDPAGCGAVYHNAEGMPTSKEGCNRTTAALVQEQAPENRQGEEEGGIIA